MSSDAASPYMTADRRALIAIDMGAESCRVSLLQVPNAGKPTIKLVHRFANRAAQRGDGLRWDMNAILREVHAGLTMCATLAPEGVRSIAVDGWAVDYVWLDKATGRALEDPFCYRDARTSRYVDALHARISAQRMRELTGVQIQLLNTVYQMAADPHRLRKLLWLNLPEYVLYTLGARPVAERTNAAHTQMMALDGCWSEEILSALDMSVANMPEIVAPGTDIGELTGPLATHPAFADCRLIAPACHDTASAIAAIPDGGDDWAYISSGTWSLVGTPLTAPLNTPATYRANFTNLAGVDGTFCFHKNVNGMWMLRQCLEHWNEGKEDGLLTLTPLTLTPLIEAAREFSPRAYVLDVDDADLLQAGDMPARINAQLRARGLDEFDRRPQHAAELASFLFHSLAVRYAEVLKGLAEITGKRLRKLYILGGGSQNDFLNELTAQTTGLDVRRAGTECSTLGNFASQLALLQDPAGARPTARAAGFLHASLAP